jgi:hypothetical protein
MNRKTQIRQLLICSCILLLIAVCFSGCTTNQSTKLNVNGDSTSFQGTWVGSIQMPMFGGDSTSSMTQIIFESNTAELTIKNPQRTTTMNTTFTVNGNTLLFQPSMNNRSGFPGGQPFNGTLPPDGPRPPGNGTFQQDGTFPGNGTSPLNRPPSGNWTGQHNWSQPPGDQQPSLSISFTYRFNENKTVLYLNDSEFIRIS